MTLVWDCVYCCSDSPVWGDLVPGQNPLRGRLQGQPALRRLWTDRGTYGASPLVWRIRISSDLHYFAGSALLPVWGSGSSEKRLLDLLIRTKFLWITGMRRRLLTHTVRLSFPPKLWFYSYFTTHSVCTLFSDNIMQKIFDYFQFYWISIKERLKPWNVSQHVPTVLFLLFRDNEIILLRI